MSEINPNTFNSFVLKPNQIKAIDLLQDLKDPEDGIEFKLRYIDRFHFVENWARVKNGCFNEIGEFFPNEIKGFWKAKVQFRERENGIPCIFLTEKIK